MLIVDDDPASVRLLGRVLHGVARLSFASQGAEALERVRTTNPDLVLLDADMPVLDGFATCAALRADPDTAHIPIIFVTAHVGTEDETRALATGAVDFIHKPVNPPVVVARVRTHLELKRRGDELRRLVSQDGLTGLSNRRAFDLHLADEWRRALRSREPLSLVMLDVDHFKRFNDRYGHPAGDECLRQVGAALLEATRRVGDLAARYGGEEFAVVLPGTDVARALAFGERLCAAVADLAIVHADSPVAAHVTASVGVATADTAGADGPCGEPADLVSLADRALYRAKAEGRARAVGLKGAFAAKPAAGA